jgi:uncharacterized RDD family membrane protein YckC
MLGLFYVGFKTSMSQTVDSIDPFMSELPLLFKISFSFLGFASFIYDWSEIIVLLTNKKRRAIHDYIAGTVVIHDPRFSRTPWNNIKAD